MRNTILRCLIAVLVLSLAPFSANAFFFIIPLPNVSKPRQLEALIDALEKSTETRAVAYVSENKTFGAKYWVWGTYSGEVSQEEADRFALERCANSLRNAKAQSAGGQPLYDFGDKGCELHPFTPNEGPKIAEAKRAAAAEARRLAAIEEEKRLAAAEEAKRIAAEEEKKRLAAEEEKRLAAEAEAKRVAEEEEARRLAIAEEEARQAKARGSRKGDLRPAARKSVAGASQQVDYEAEATKAAKILGCQPTELRVAGAEGGNIQYRVSCAGARLLFLSCDSAGLCLQRKPAASSKS